ncbi:MAG: porin [Lewinellaceae bacterium]|nr:hypothetical protein [Saprospiraceae bacterium]MCB9333741.1 porin [Lewinellaceae bacterium]
MRIVCCVLFASVLYFSASAQIIPKKFGDGIQLYGKDSSYFLHFGFRFQTLFTNSWTNISGNLTDHRASLLIRRSRLKFDGYAVDPRLTYKFELALSNNDMSGGDGEEHANASNIVLDASMSYNFYKNFSIQFGQGKLPGNRERVISSANLQFVDRSRLNSRFNIDRDVGFQLKHHFTTGKRFLIREVFAFSQGEGRNVTQGHFGGFDYTFRVEFLPFGSFKSKGDYSGSALERESKPKLSVGFTYDVDAHAVREHGQLGSFIRDVAGNYYGRTLNTFFADCMFKYQGWSVMAEYADKRTGSQNSLVFDPAGNLIGTYYTGSAYVIDLGYLFANNWEIAGRYCALSPDAGVANDEKEYTLGVSKFIVGHKLKIQTDLSYRDVADRNGQLSWRLQTELHF